MPEEANRSNQDGQDGSAPQEPWWRRKIKILNIEGPVLMIIGVFAGILFSFIFLVINPVLFVQPLTANSVRATVAAQTTIIPPTLPASTPENQNTAANLVSIEEFPGELFAYQGLDGYGDLSIIRNADEDLDYLFTYEMPANEEGYAGIFFRFTPTRDLTEFVSLRAIFSFGDDKAQCTIYLEDHNGAQSSITLRKNELDNASADAKMEIEGDRRILTIPLANNFLDVPDKRSIEGIGVGVNSTLVEGSHNCTIHEIELLK